MPRIYEDEMKFLDKVDKNIWKIKKGFVPNMNVKGVYINDHLEKFGGFLPAMKQIANVAALPGIVYRSIGLPDIHSGYGFAIGNIGAFDMNNPDSIASPGGVGFDINYGVRL